MVQAVQEVPEVRSLLHLLDLLARYITNLIANHATSARTRIAPTIQIKRDRAPDVGSGAGWYFASVVGAPQR